MEMLARSCGVTTLRTFNNVVVEVTTHDDRCVRVLPDDILNDVQDSLGPVLQVLLLPRVKITVENLDIRVPELELGPTHVSPE